MDGHHPVPQIPCPSCDRTLDLATIFCRNCGDQNIGLPNVRVARQPGEKGALAARVDSARARADAEGCRPQLDSFEAAVGTSKAIMGFKVARLLPFFDQPDGLYTNYYSQRRSGRPQRNEPYEGNRERIDPFISPGYFRELTCAALSLEDWGARHYGDCFLVFRDDAAMARRATVFEKNPFIFVDEVTPTSKESCPLGYRADWTDRAALAVAKLHTKISAETKPEEFPGILLEKDPDDTEQTDFIEVHYYGDLPHAAVELVSYFPAAVTQRGWGALTDMLEDLGIAVKALP